MFVRRKTYLQTLELLDDARDALQRRNYDIKRLQNILKSIIKQKTPNANATVTRIVNIAEKGLKWGRD